MGGKLQRLWRLLLGYQVGGAVGAAAVVRSLPPPRRRGRFSHYPIAAWWPCGYMHRADVPPSCAHRFAPMD